MPIIKAVKGLNKSCCLGFCLAMGLRALSLDLQIVLVVVTGKEKKKLTILTISSVRAIGFISLLSLAPFHALFTSSSSSEEVGKAP